MQQINLYQAELQPARQPFSSVRLVQSLIGMLAVLALVSGLVVWDDARKAAAVKSLGDQRDQMKAQLARLEAEFPPPQQDPNLKAGVERLERVLAAKQAFLANFSTSGAGSVGAEGFSPILQALARRPWSGLWLSEIQLQGDGAMALHGSATRPDAVPRFVKGLAEEPVFLGREFKTMRIVRPTDAGSVEFSLRTSGLKPAEGGK